MQVRGMLKQSRGKTEPWLEWYKRSLRMARVQIHKRKIERWSTFVLARIWPLYGHVARGDAATASMLTWRGMKWWQTQQSIPVSWGGEQHAQRFNPMLDTERHIVEIAGLDWQSKARDRLAWSLMEDQFVANKVRHTVGVGETTWLGRRRPARPGNRRSRALRDFAHGCK